MLASSSSDELDPKPASKSASPPSSLGYLDRRSAVYVVLFLLVYLVYRHFTAPPLPFRSLGRVPTRDARNWGEFVAYGRARDQMLEHSDPEYPGLGERYLLGLRTRRSTSGSANGQGAGEGGEGKVNRMLETRKGAISGDDGFERERHGIYGGAHWDWSTGIVGVGAYFGPLDMRKRSPSSSSESAPDNVKELDGYQKAALEHYLSNAWEVKDANEAKHRKEILGHSYEERMEKGLPMRDVAAGNKTAEREAAETWMRVYAAFHRQASKSAVQLAIEKLVRRVPVVVFVDGKTDESDELAKTFKRLRVSPDPLVIDVQKRRACARAPLLSSEVDPWTGAQRTARTSPPTCAI